MTKASILPQLVNMMGTGILSYEVEQSVNGKITQKDTLKKTYNRLHFHKKIKTPNKRTDKYYNTRKYYLRTKAISPLITNIQFILHTRPGII